jgi:Skp family chaperone for outer membrane proteins
MLFSRVAIRTLVMVGVVAGIGAWAGDMAVVDMDKVVKAHPRTKADRAILQSYIDDYEAEREELLGKMEALAKAFEALRVASEDDALSTVKREAKREMAKMKLEERMQLERQVRRMAMARQKELTNREVQMRKRVVSEVSKVVRAVALEEGVDWVFSNSESEMTAFPAVVVAPSADDMTDKVLEAIAALGSE